MAFKRAVVTGSSGWYDTEAGHTLSILLEYDEMDLVLDAGSGFAALDRYISCDRHLYLFLSHFHLDHICGLHVLNRFQSLPGLTIIGQEGTREVLKNFLHSPFTIPMERLPFPVEILEVPAESEKLPFKHRVAFLDHADPCLGLRLEHGGRSIAFCTDTGFCDAAVDLARDADLLFTECAWPPGFERPQWPHLNPEKAAAIAREAGAHRLCLVHFDAFNYPTREKRLIAEETAREIFSETVAGFDGMEIIF